MSNVFEESLKLHEEHRGKVEVISKVKVVNKEDLSKAYSRELQNLAEKYQKILQKYIDIQLREIWLR